MSKPIKQMIVKEYRKRFEGAEAAVLVEIRGLNATATNKMRTDLSHKSVRVSVVKNSLARAAFKGSAFEKFASHLTGPSAVIYSEGSVVDLARDLMKWSRGVEQFVFKAAVLEGIVFEGPAGIAKLSKMPTRAEAQSNVVTLMLSPARNVTGAAKGPGSRVMGIVKEIEARLEKGETIAAIAG